MWPCGTHTRSLLSQYPRDRAIAPSQLPPLLRELPPARADIDKRGWLWLEFGGGFHHHGLIVLPDSDMSSIKDDDHVAHTQLTDGIWYYEEVN